MSNIIALIWDFDKTLVDGYMQDPLFAEYGIDNKKFWKEVNALPEKYEKEQGVRVNKDSIYLNHILNYVKAGKFKGLNNEKLNHLGGEIKFYPGVLELFPATIEMIKNNDVYKEFNIRLEHYIVSTGLSQMIWGSPLARYVDGIWGCDFIESTNPETQEKELSEIVYTIDNTTKTRAIFEINKGVGHRDGIEVNSKLSEEMRRVPFKNMIYIADGPSDIPAFSLINSKGGATFAVYPHGNNDAFRQVESLRKDGRVQMYGEADYSENTLTYLWLKNTILDIADRIVAEEKAKLTPYVKPQPRHLV
ncbi:HAD family hydrolase [Desulfovibrio piger]|nr:HAD family hydrolase [Desulfovibrio piger]